MIRPPGFRVRYRVRIGKALNSEAVSQTLVVAGRNVTIKSQEKGQRLWDTTWLILDARGFDVEREARDFGEQLGVIVQIAALSCNLGVDVGRSEPDCFINEDLLRKIGRIKDHERVKPNIHGLIVIPDDEDTLFPLVKAQIEVTKDPAQLIDAMSELANRVPLEMNEAAPCVRLLNLALMSTEPLSQIVLAFSAVEALGQNEKWTAGQAELLKQLAKQVEQGASGDDEEASEVAEALRRSLHRIGLRQGVKRVLSSLDLSHLVPEWDRLYPQRSGVFHGTAGLTQKEMNRLANEIVKLAGTIILALIQRSGIKLPSVASKHFQIHCSITS